MKKTLTFIIVFALLLNIESALAISKPTEALISDEQKAQAAETTAPVRAATYETRKAAIITVTNTTLLALRNIEQQINDSLYLNASQKKDLLAIIDNTTKNIEKYQKDVKATQNADELLKVNQALATYLKDNKEEIRATIAKVILIGVEGTISAAKQYLATAEEVSQALKLCGSDTATMDEYIKKGNAQVTELEKLVQEIMADGKVTKEESSQVKQAARLAGQLSITLATITTEAAVSAESCPVAEKYLDELKKYT